MTNIYDVLAKLHVKATGSVQGTVKSDLKKKDPPIEEAKAILEEDVTEEAEPEPESNDENTEGDDSE
jgi:hypothetical protein